MKHIELTNQKNIRDLGGLIGHQQKKVKYGKLFRGGFLDKLTLEDVVVMNSLHITDIIDFRSEKENLIHTDYPLEGATYHNFPPLLDNVKEEDQKIEDGNLLWFVAPGNTGFNHMMDSYRHMVTSKEGIEAFRNFFKIIESKEDGVFYFHCSQGKDRAGLAAYFVEIALGVSQVSACKDYLRTNKAMKSRVEYLINQVKDRPYYNEQYKSSLIAVFTAKIEYLYAAIEEMKKMHGSVLEYIKKELDVDIDKLRKLYLE